MSHDLTIPAIQAPTTLDPPARQARPARGTDAPATSSASASPYVNPTLRLDAELGLVVMEFRDDSGALTSTIPSERQIEAYRAHQDPVHQARSGEAGSAEAGSAPAEPAPTAEEEPPREAEPRDA